MMSYLTGAVQIRVISVFFEQVISFNFGIK